ncbi:hypothetical protein LOC68_26375 [Blastopirellula sp. JC732]|uniref:Uncharacterized protein n=1 Tax=Blastopirellula sediminis TaxID=2894196 RepID=A0A9X1MSZ8_9BACT|nr:hypothetical protein [Blastopirellula sediminis]MCC9604764.1 hypothetical protein [Blastopirellula sediminis]MCC9631937.1 hypothetical protein [Blastopirellula sediminis]
MAQIKHKVTLVVERRADDSIQVARKNGVSKVRLWKKVRPGDHYKVDPPPQCDVRFLSFAEIEAFADGENVLEFEERSY